MNAGPVLSGHEVRLVREHNQFHHMYLATSETLFEKKHLANFGEFACSSIILSPKSSEQRFSRYSP